MAVSKALAREFYMAKIGTWENDSSKRVWWLKSFTQYCSANNR